MDRTREAVFNVLNHHLDFSGKTVLDGFAGSGAYGFEALSRGAQSVIFIDQALEATRMIHENCRVLKMENSCRIITGDIHQIPRCPTPVDLVFLDPPYHQNLIHSSLTHLVSHNWIDHRTLIVLERDEKENFQEEENGQFPWKVLFNRRYGKNNIFLIMLM